MDAAPATAPDDGTATSGPLPEQAPCTAWSQHAADLAREVAPLLQTWPENPATQSMVADGVVHRLLPGVFVPGWVELSAVDRAVALGCALGSQLRPYHVLAGATAVWVLCGGVPPQPVELVTSSHRTVVAGALIRNASLPPGDVELLGGVPLTAPGRAAVDLLRFAPEHVALAGVRALVRSGHGDPREVSARVAGLRGVPHSRMARRRLALLEAEQPRSEQPQGEQPETGEPEGVVRRRR